MRDFYVCPRALVQALRGTGIGYGWEGGPSGSAVPDDLVLCYVAWPGWAEREQFEAQAGVVPLGAPWELVAAAAIPVLEALRPAIALAWQERLALAAGGKVVVRAAARDLQSPIDGSHTVAQALRKLGHVVEAP